MIIIKRIWVFFVILLLSPIIYAALILYDLPQEVFIKGEFDDEDWNTFK